VRIAYLASGLSHRAGGIATVVEALSGTLCCMAGVEVRVIGLSDDLWEARDRHTWRGGDVIGLPTIGPKSLGFAPGMEKELLSWSPDVVHTHGLWMYPSRAAWQWARKTGGPHVVSPHGMLDNWALRRSRLKKQAARFLYEQDHLRSASVIHALCTAEAASVRAFGLSNSIMVIPNGVDPPATVEGTRPPWASLVSQSDSVMLFLGRIDKKKNIVPFLKTWAEASHTANPRKAWKLVIVGWGSQSYEALVQSTIRGLNLESEVFVLGPLYGIDKAAAYRSATAFVLPSLSEGFPMAVLEAWSYGLPVLMTDACNLSEAFEVGAGYRLALEPNQMVDSLRSFLALQTKVLAAMGNRGRILTQQRFSWAAVANDMVELYRGLCVSRATR
jgi:glycosyltransferase involved in cell wall biosynthesis